MCLNNLDFMCTLHNISNYYLSNFIKCCFSDYVCHQCSKRYKWERTLIRHLRYECQKQPAFFCSYCHKSVVQSGSLNRHMIGCAKRSTLIL